jgi:hypothetical protein
MLIKKERKNVGINNKFECIALKLNTVKAFLFCSALCSSRSTGLDERNIEEGKHGNR